MQKCIKMHFCIATQLNNDLFKMPLQIIISAVTMPINFRLEMEGINNHATKTKRQKHALLSTFLPLISSA